MEQPNSSTISLTQKFLDILIGNLELINRTTVILSVFPYFILDLTQNSIPLKTKITQMSILNHNTTRLQSAQTSNRGTVCLLQNLFEKKNNDKPQDLTINFNLEKGINRAESNSLQKKVVRQYTGRFSIPRVEIKKQDEIKKQLQKYFSESSILSNYQILSHIGKGSFAAVSLAIEKSTQKQFAVKIYEKLALKDPHRLQNIRRQIKNLKTLNHKNIIHLIHAVSQKRKIFLIMDYAGRHSMEGIIRKKQNKRLPEIEAKRYFQQILSAVACCHRNNITHRDIKLENILVSENNQIKLIDFGFSVMSKEKLNTFCGTPSFMAPQIIGKLSYQGQYVDIWACGILLYVMLCGSYPFRGMNQKQLFRNIRTGKYQYKQDVEISQAAKRVISKMLKLIPNQRSTAEQLMYDKWFQQ